MQSGDEATRNIFLNDLNRTFINSNSGFGYDFSERLFRKIDCHEFSSDEGIPQFDNGNLVRKLNDPCKDEALDRLYDSAKFNLTSPIYYLSGTNDPAAPFTGAYYHFENHIRSRRNFIKVPGGGHNQIGDIFPDCFPKIWDAILKTEDLDKIVPTCKAPVELTIREAL